MKYPSVFICLHKLIVFIRMYFVVIYILHIPFRASTECTRVDTVDTKKKIKTNFETSSDIVELHEAFHDHS